MKEPTTYPFGELRILDEKVFNSWKKARNDFSCEFCGHKFAVGDAMKCTYSNGVSRSGNPLTCSLCAEISYENRLNIWKAMGDRDFCFNAAKKSVGVE